MSDDQNKRATDMLCKALDMAENAVKLYDKALEGCSELGAEVFGALKEDKEEHIRRIQQTYKGLTKGQDWENACQLPEEETLGREFFRQIAAKYDEFQTCPASEKDALDTALDLEQRMVAFYEFQVDQAEDPVEELFMEQLLEESRGHQMILVDMQHYYEDPMAWGREGSLDGA